MYIILPSPLPICPPLFPKAPSGSNFQLFHPLPNSVLWISVALCCYIAVSSLSPTYEREHSLSYIFPSEWLHSAYEMLLKYKLDSILNPKYKEKLSCSKRKLWIYGVTIIVCGIRLFTIISKSGLALNCITLVQNDSKLNHILLIREYSKTKYPLSSTC